MTQIIEAKEDLPDTPLLPKRLRLTTARDIRRELARLYGLVMAGRISNDTGRTAGFLLQTLLSSIRHDEFETRLADLEKRIE